MAEDAKALIELATRRFIGEVPALERMLAYLHELRERGASDWIVQHAQAPADAERLVAEGTALFGFGPLFCTQVGPVLGAHLGSGMLVGGMTRP